MDCPVVVSVRCRRITPRERELGALRVPHRANTNYCCVEPKDDHTLVVSDPDSTCTIIRRERVYTFDRVFDADVSNEDVFAVAVAPLIPALVQGYNATCFAYGMTGAGKTYTMVGDEATGVRGLCALCVDTLFYEESRARREHGAVMTIHASYLEIYNEKIKDLLGPSGPTPSSPKRTSTGGGKGSPSLDIIEDAARGVVVLGLTEHLVTTLKDLQSILLVGTERRTMASTGSNVASSRSHAVLQLTVRVSTALQTNNGRLMLIDLAGSERATHYTGNMTDRAKTSLRTLEGSNINKSLLALGNCITLLGSSHHGGGVTQHIPYRDSKLTRLLKDSLGGNTRTVMIATVSPSCLCYEETLSTLKYATRAKLITKRVYKNRSDSAQSNSSDYEAMRVSLHHEISTLKTQLTMAQRANTDHDQRQQASFRRSASSRFHADDATSIERRRDKRAHFATLLALKEQLLAAEVRHMEELPPPQSRVAPVVLSRPTEVGHPVVVVYVSPPRRAPLASWRDSNALVPNVPVPNKQTNALPMRPTAAGRDFLASLSQKANVDVASSRPKSPQQSRISAAMESRKAALSQIDELLFAKSENRGMY